MQAIVTFKLKKNPKHDPKWKITGQCPCNPLAVCTDVTGQHHSRLITGRDMKEIEDIANNYLGHHITRIEQV